MTNFCYSRFSRDRRGLAALELGLLAPIMFTLLFATYEIVTALRMQARLSTTAGELAELVAASGIVTAPGGTLADLCTGASLNLLPFSPFKMRAAIASVTNDHPSNRGAGSGGTNTKDVHAYLDWALLSACGTTSTYTIDLPAAFAAANSPQSMLTKSGVSAANTNDTANLAYGFSAIVVVVQYDYTNVRPGLISPVLALQATAVARPRGGKITCTSKSGVVGC